MPNDIDLARLRELLERGHVQLLEVLPQSEYDEEHLPGAINVPLKSLTPNAVAGFDRSRPTVVYCWDDI
ncbi:MAG: rhodanese-like domain-containing protein [Rubrobacter sp.]|jgi:rhodanese-related sulfurtransferase|nr:rhodanese-like domain-containing protein [Rubrobacter sp.]